MTALATDLLVLWAAATVASTGLLAVVVLGQNVLARARRAARRRPRGLTSAGGGSGPRGGPAASR